MKKITLDIDPYTFTGSAVIIGLILVNELSDLEQDSVGNWLQLIGLVMQTYASQVSVIESENQPPDQQDTIETLQKALQKIEKELESLKNNKTKTTD